MKLELDETAFAISAKIMAFFYQFVRTKEKRTKQKTIVSTEKILFSYPIQHSIRCVYLQ